MELLLLLLFVAAVAITAVALKEDKIFKTPVPTLEELIERTEVKPKKKAAKKAVKKTAKKAVKKTAKKAAKKKR